MISRYAMVPLSEILSQYQEYIDEPEPITYPKLSVKLYGKGVVLDAPVDGSSLKMQRHQIAKKGQVILSEIWGKKGAIGIVPPEGDTALCTSHFFLFDVQEDRVNRKYLQAIFTANYLAEQLDSEAKGTTGYAAVRPKHLLTAKIPLPPLEEQHRIVARIEELAAKIEEARGLKREMVQETKILETSMLANLLIQTSSKKCKLEEICVQITDGEHITPQRVPKDSETIPLATAKNVRDGYLDLENTDFVSMDTAENCWRRCYPQPDDILMVCVGATTGRICRLIDATQIVIVRSVAMIRANKNVVYPKFLEYTMRSSYCQSQIWSLVKQAAQPGLYIHRMKQLLIQVPSLELQMSIINQLDKERENLKMLERIQAETTKELNALLPSILNKAFKGEL